MNSSATTVQHHYDSSPVIPAHEALFLRLSSAVEALVTAAVLCAILPSLIRKRKRSSFYPRLAISYLLILLIILIRFYDFLDTNIFQSLSKVHRVRFLLYGLATLEAMYDMSVVSLGTETCLELCSTLLPDRSLWILFGVGTVGVPVAFLLIILTIWESSHAFRGVLAVALTESVLPGLALLILTGLVAWQGRRKRLALTEDCLLRVKIILMVNSASLAGLVINLLLYAVDSAVVMDDLIDSLIKLCVCGCYLLVQPGCPAAPHLLPCLHTTEVSLGPVSSIQSTILQEGGRPAMQQEVY